LPELTIPAFICEISDEEKAELERLLFRFGTARRRAYALKQKGWIKSEIEKLLQEGLGLNSRYIKDAYWSIKDLPAHVTFGGLRNQRLREKGKITREEYRRRRNSIIISRGDKSKKGNLNLRLDLEAMELRINTGSDRRWICPKIFIPKKYLERYGHLLDGSKPYTVYIKRRDNDAGYDVRIVVEALKKEHRVKDGRVMALDVNSGHVDFAVAEEERVIAVGRVNCHSLRDYNRDKTQNYLYKLVRKIGNIAKHYHARVVVGKIRTSNFKSHPRANRRVHGMPFYRIVQILKYKLSALEKSEHGTSKLAEVVVPKVGLDVHKVSACMLALKTLNYDSFSSLRDVFLRGVRAGEGGGSLSTRLSAGSGVTPLHHQGVVHDEVAGGARNGGYPATPGSRGLPYLGSLKTSLPCLHVKIC
jgi:IS605 OrfB family transposase